MPHSAERKRLQHSGGTGKGLEDCEKASIGVWGSAESQGRDSIPLLGPEPLRAIVHVNTVCVTDRFSFFPYLICG